MNENLIHLSLVERRPSSLLHDSDQAVHQIKIGVQIRGFGGFHMQRQRQIVISLPTLVLQQFQPDLKIMERRLIGRGDFRFPTGAQVEFG